MGHSLSSVNNNIVVERRLYESDSVVCENSRQDRGTRMCLVNAQSVCNKALQLHDLVLDNDLDLCVITETWLKGDARDNTIVAELTPPGFKLVHRPRQGRGGGVAIIHSEALKVTNSSMPSFRSFEIIESLFDTSPPLRLAAIYRPPPSIRNQSTFELFLSEFGDYLEDIIMKPGRLIITGDFNLHVDNDTNCDAAEFMSCLESSDLLQHVRSSTHGSGHILDLVISRKRDCIDPRVIVSEGVSDHHALNWCLPIAKKRLTSRV
ncbi:hypothetical protein CAPTEDRAFT_207616, partial [Capitella teleta]